MFNYAWGVVPDTPYAFRSRARLRIGRGVDHVPIVEIFLREEYGKVADGAIIVDVGANIGAFSIFAATSARGVVVYAYEPMPEFYRLMEENLRLNRLELSVRSFNLAVGAHSGIRQLFLENPTFSFPTFLRGGDRVARTVEVPCVSLAEILDSNGLVRVDLLKMDCEGAEYEIMYGTPHRYLERIREMRMEYHNLDTQRCCGEALGAFLQTHGYDVTIAPTTAAGGNLRARKHD